MSERTSESLDLVIARLIVGEQAPEELPDVAASALAAGLDSPALREAAGVARSDPRSARDVFTRAIQELGFAIPDETTARWRLVRNWASEVATGQLDPVAGARLIWTKGWNDLGRPEELTPFVALADDWEERPEDRGAIERDIVATAIELMQED